MAEHQAQYVAANDENMDKLIDELDKQNIKVNTKQHLKDIEKTLSEIEKAKNDDLSNRPDMKFAIKAVALLLVSKEGFKHEDAVKLAYNEVRNVEQNMEPRIQKANALALGTMGLAGITLLAITVKAIQDKYDIDLGNKGSIFSTPIHKDEEQKLETPAHEEGAKTESFPGEENTLNQQPGLEHPGTGFKLPGFEVEEDDDLNIFYSKNKAIGDSEWKEKLSKGKIIYKPAGYHGKHSHGDKSSEPKNPSNAIPGSVPLSDESTGRIGVDAENKEIIILRETERRPDGTVVYHGHSAKWEELKQPQKNAAMDTGLVDKKGNIKPPKKDYL